MKKEIKELKNILKNGEKLACFTCVNDYSIYNFIVPSDTDNESIKYIDIASCLENTLYRMLENHFSNMDIVYNSNMENLDKIIEYNEETDIYIDLDYVIRDGLLKVWIDEKEGGKN